MVAYMLIHTHDAHILGDFTPKAERRRLRVRSRAGLAVKTDAAAALGIAVVTPRESKRAAQHMTVELLPQGMRVSEHWAHKDADTWASRSWTQKALDTYQRDQGPKDPGTFALAPFCIGGARTHNSGPPRTQNLRAGVLRDVGDTRAWGFGHSEKGNPLKP